MSVSLELIECFILFHGKIVFLDLYQSGVHFVNLHDLNLAKSIAALKLSLTGLYLFAANRIQHIAYTKRKQRL